MRRPASAALLAASLLGLLALGGCTEARYLGVFTLATSADENADPPPPPANLAVDLRYREPNDRERELYEMLSEEAGYEIPFVRIGDVTLEVDYVVKNLSDEPINVTVGIDGSNPFGSYDADLVPVGEDEEAPPTLLSAFQRLEPGESVSNVFTEEDLREAAIDLDTIVRFSGDGTLPQAAIFNSSRDTEIGLGDRPNGERPEDTPAMTQLLIKLRADGPAALDFTVRIIDRQDRLADEDDGG